VVADPALGGSEDRVVVNTIADEHLGAAIVHEGRHADDQCPAGVPEPLVNARIEAEPLGHRIELLDGGPVQVR
jgi:hypothetical protein